MDVPEASLEISVPTVKFVTFGWRQFSCAGHLKRRLEGSQRGGGVLDWFQMVRESRACRSIRRPREEGPFRLAPLGLGAHQRAGPAVSAGRPRDAGLRRTGGLAKLGCQLTTPSLHEASGSLDLCGNNREAGESGTIGEKDGRSFWNRSLCDLSRLERWQT